MEASTQSSRRLKKLGLVALGCIGVCICIGVLAASLAPSPGQPYRPIGGVLGSLGLLTSIWFIWLAFRTPTSEPAPSTQEGRSAARAGPYSEEKPDSLEEARFPNLASIKTKTFRLGMKGYNVNEVDQFLSALGVELVALQSALEAAESEVTRLKWHARS